MRQDKINRMMAEYHGHNGPVTINAVKSQMPDLWDALTGKQLGMIMDAVNRAYHNGRSSHGGIDLCDDAVWLPWGGSVDNGKERGQLIPINALRQIQIAETHQVRACTIMGEPNTETITTRKYSLDYTEVA